MKHEPYYSYLVRFWQEDGDGESQLRWRGEVQSIQTGQKRQFNSLPAMVRYLQLQVELYFSDNPRQNGGQS